MDNEDKLRRQRKLAKVFLEMGMDLDLIEQISGLNKEEFVDIQEQTIYNSLRKSKNDSYSEPRDRGNRWYGSNPRNSRCLIPSKFNLIDKRKHYF